MPPVPYAVERDEGERLQFGDAVILLRSTTEVSDGGITGWEELSPLLGTPLHVHASEDECFHILGIIWS